MIGKNLSRKICTFLFNKSVLRLFINWNLRLSKAFDRLLPPEYSVDGNTDFAHDFAPSFIRPGFRVVDIGGGKNPFILLERKAALGLHVTGIDISFKELQSAPAGAYDEVVCSDIARVRGNADADLCICRAVLEHVRDVDSAIASIASLLKPGGRAVLFVPSRNAVFARINLLLPQSLKRRLLFAVYPQAARDQGFLSFYNKCTPASFRLMAQAAGLEVERERHYFVSSYFMFFAPLHLLWRCWLLGFRRVAGTEAAETFSMSLRKRG